VTTALGLGLALVGGGPAGAAGTTEVTARVSVTSAGTEVKVDTEWIAPAVDTTGRFVAFSGNGAYDPADTNGQGDVYVRDRLVGTTTRVSLTDAEEQITGSSSLCGASGDLRYVGFWSNGTNLPGTVVGQIYVRDRTTGSTRLASIGAGGLSSLKPGGGSGIVDNGRCDISLDGRYVVFASEGNNFVADGNGVEDVFRRDLQTSTTIRVSVKNDENEITGAGSTEPQISDDGNKVVFETEAQVTNSDGNGTTDVFLRTISTGVTSVLSLRPNASYPAGHSTSPAISGNGLVYAFNSQATDLNPAEPDDNGTLHDVYVSTGGSTKTRVSVSSTEEQGNQLSHSPALSVDGRYVAFVSSASNLWPLDGNGFGSDTFVRDRQTGLTVVADRRVESVVTSGYSTDGHPGISADGTAVAYGSVAPDLVRNDGNGKRDVFVRDIDASHAPFASFDKLVTRQFQDFYGRTPTAAEATEWRQRLRHGEVSSDEVIADLAHSQVWSQHRGPVARLYWSFFLRAPDAAGLDYWVAQKVGGKGLHTIAGQFAQSQEFKTLYGSLGNSAFVTLVYQNVLQRDPAPDEVTYWSGQLSSGAKSRGSVMVGFSESAEGRAFLAPQVDVVLVHLGMFGTIPNKATFTEMTGYLDDGAPLEVLIAILRLSPGYAAQL
jgi:Tol biopolymer transport system component